MIIEQLHTHNLVFHTYNKISILVVASGYSHITHNVLVKDSSPMIFASPKSAIFTDNSLSASNIFSGLISRCTIFRSCWIRSEMYQICATKGLTRYLMPWNNCTNTFRVSCSVNFCFMTIKLNNSPSGASSSTRYTPSSSSKVSLRHSRFGWLTDLRTPISCCSPSVRDLSSPARFSNRLTAYCVPVPLSTHR